jgi:hypothetical protein
MSARSESIAGTRDRTTDLTGHNAMLGNLIAAKARVLASMIVIYMVGYIGVTALAGFARGFVPLASPGRYQ